MKDEEPGGGPGVYSIGATARLVGVPAGTLRSWEERYGVVVPRRTAGDQRLYTRDHLEQLRYVREQMDSGLSAADAHRALSERLAAAATGLGSARSDVPRIALVERDRFAADLFDYFLRTEGYDVRLARDVQAAAHLIAFDDDPADLVIIDLLIGGGAGLGLCQQISGRAPVLALSALDHSDKAFVAGAQAFLRKPVDPLHLVSVARDLLRTSAMMAEHPRVGQPS